MSMSLSKRTAARISMLALSLAAVGAAGATSASAAAIHPDSTSKYVCTATNPEICFSLTQNSGSFEFLENIHVNGSVSAIASASGPNAYVNWGTHTVTNGWSGNLPQSFPGSLVAGDRYCALFGSAYAACIVW
jgi:hypothetical protein